MNPHPLNPKTLSPKPRSPQPESQEVMRGTPRDATLSALIPELSGEEARRRFIKYNFYRTRYEGYAKLHGIREDDGSDENGHLAASTSKHMSRKMSSDDLQRHRHATKQGALPPAASRPSGAFSVSKVSFGGPVIKGARPHKQHKKGVGEEGHVKVGKGSGSGKSSRPASALQARKVQSAPHSAATRVFPFAAASSSAMRWQLLHVAAPMSDFLNPESQTLDPKSKPLPDGSSAARLPSSASEDAQPRRPLSGFMDQSKQ